MKKYDLRFAFFWGKEVNDRWEFQIEVPEVVTKEEIEETIKKTHAYLDKETTLYDKYGRNPETLLNYIFDKYGWKWKRFAFEIDIDCSKEHW